MREKINYTISQVFPIKQSNSSPIFPKEVDLQRITICYHLNANSVYSHSISLLKSRLNVHMRVCVPNNHFNVSKTCSSHNACIRQTLTLGWASSNVWFVAILLCDIQYAYVFSEYVYLTFAFFLWLVKKIPSTVGRDVWVIRNVWISHTKVRAFLPSYPGVYVRHA